MLKLKYLGGVSTAAFALSAFVAGAANAQAQTAASTPSTVEEVVVTGSFIAGTPKDTAIPVSVVTQAELERRGSPSVLEIIKQLPVSGPVLGDQNQFSVAAQGRSGGGTINLRGLGAARTLVLVNGRRFTGYTSDTNLLPVAAIGRVEILKDGAAATYGSDAIGGVANFITRTNFEGFEFQGDYRYVSGSDTNDYSASGLYGWRGDTANLLFSMAYQHRGEVSTVKRSWVTPAYPVNPSGWSTFSNPGGFTIRGGPNGTGSTLGFAADANCAAVGGFAGFAGTTPNCYWSFVPFDNLVDAEDKYQVFGEFNADVGDSAKFHVEALYSQTSVPEGRTSPGYVQTSGPNGPGTVNVFTTPSTNPGFNTFLTQTGNAALIGTAESVQHTFWRTFALGGNPKNDGRGGQKLSRKYEEIRISAGLKGETGFAGIKYDLGMTAIRELQHQETEDALIVRTQAALNGLGGPNCRTNTPGANGCMYLNPFSNAYPGNPALELTNPGFVSANANNVDLVRWLFDRQRFKATLETFVADAVFSGALPITLPGGDVGWAAGAQYRKIDYNQRISPNTYNANITPCPIIGSASCAQRTGPFIFLGQNIPLELEQSVYALFGELQVPVTETINLQLAARYEDYGGQTGSTFNPQFRGKWQVVDFLAVRGSVGTSFRGPTAANVAPTGATGLQGLAAAGNNFKSVDFFGNPATNPEKAFTYSLGAIVQYENFTATVDYWYYRMKDQITTVPAALVANSVAGTGNGTQLVNCAAALRSLITFSNNNVCVQGVTVGNDIQRVRADTTNGPTVRTDGIDVDVSYRFDELMGGSLDLGATVSYVLNYKQAAFVFGGLTVSPAYNAVGFTNYDRLPGTIPDWRGQFYADYTRGNQNLRWQIQYVDGATDNRGPTVTQSGPSTNCSVATALAGTATNCVLTTRGLRVRSFIMHDLVYRINLWDDTTITASVLNVFDREPSKARLELSYDPFIGNPLERTFKIAVKKTF